MTHYTLLQIGTMEYMPVNNEGQIGRVDRMTGKQTVTPSDSWRVVGAVRYNNFGHQVEFVPFPQCARIKDWLHKNGKAKWNIVDNDHGTRRMWGNAAKLWERTE